MVRLASASGGSVSNAWKITVLQRELKELHPTMTHVNLDEDGYIDMYFFDGHPMCASEFVYGSKTREILEELEELLLDE